jgi:hypothetical protein
LEEQVRQLADPQLIAHHDDDEDLDDLKTLVRAGKEGLRIPEGKEGWEGVRK